MKQWFGLNLAKDYRHGFFIFKEYVHSKPKMSSWTFLAKSSQYPIYGFCTEPKSYTENLLKLRPIRMKIQIQQSCDIVGLHTCPSCSKIILWSKIQPCKK